MTTTETATQVANSVKIYNAADVSSSLIYTIEIVGITLIVIALIIILYCKFKRSNTNGSI